MNVIREDQFGNLAHEIRIPCGPLNWSKGTSILQKRKIKFWHEVGLRLTELQKPADQWLHMKFCHITSKIDRATDQ